MDIDVHIYIFFTEPSESKLQKLQYLTLKYLHWIA